MGDIPIRVKPTNSRGSVNCHAVRLSCAAFLLLLSGTVLAQTGASLTAYHDFGRIPPNAPAFHQFALRNPTTAALRITEVRPSCDCLQVGSLPAEIPANGQAPLQVQAIPNQPGPVEWTIAVAVAGETCPRLFGLSAWGTDGTNSPADTSLLARPAELAAINPPPADLVFVDVRSAEQFRLARIPGSLNLPLPTLKTRNFLKTKRLILLGDGSDDATLLTECARLRQFGFGRVEVLDGGLRGWQMAGGAVEGQQGNRAGAFAIAPEQYHASRANGNWVVVRLANPSRSWDDWFSGPNAQAVVLNPASLSTELAALAARQPSGTRCLVMPPGGDLPAELEKAVAEFRSMPVFILAGGVPAYRDFLARQLHQLNRRQVVLAGAASPRSGFGSGGAGGSPGGCGCGHR